MLGIRIKRLAALFALLTFPASLWVGVTRQVLATINCPCTEGYNSACEAGPFQTCEGQRTWFVCDDLVFPVPNDGPFNCKVAAGTTECRDGLAPANGQNNDRVTCTTGYLCSWTGSRCVQVRATGPVKFRIKKISPSCS
jgi:hypothetical protein